MDQVTAAELEKVITESLADWVERQPGLRQRLRKALETDAPIPVIRSMSYEEFLDWLDEDTVAEWVNGEVIVASPASLVHQDLSSFLEFILRAFTEKHRLGLVVRSPFQMKLSESGREPDVLFLNTEHLQRFKGVYLEGPADLVIEIGSPSTIAVDRGDKFLEYEEGRVPEYWLIDPGRQQAEFYQLTDEGHYRPILPDENGVYHSKVINGFWLRVTWLWQRPLPPVLDVLRELKLI